MLREMRRIFILILFAAAMLPAAAFNISGTVFDEESSPLPSATVRIVTARDSSYVAGGTTSADGRFSFKGVAAGRYKGVASSVGYRNSVVAVTLKDRNAKLDSIKLEPASVMLSEATVTGIRTPVKVMQDTVEFNADSYKTQPNAMVEDLLKRLPGVEVDADGKITANGKEITKILVDGKEFFSDDPTVASRNLPVDMVDKLQVVDRKSDLARITGVDDGEEETVINLTVKKGMKNGWFGNAEAGYGTDDRYSANFNVNRFWGDNQITFLGSANNINQLGFNDGNAGRFRWFGGSNGISTSQAFGVNFNVGNKEIFRVGGDVMYSHSERDTRERRDRQYLFEDSTSYDNSMKRALDRGHNIRGDFRVQWNPDSMNTFEFRPNFSINISRSSSQDSSLTRSGDHALVTESFNDARNRGRSFEFGGMMIYNHKFRSRPGRSFSVHANYRLSNMRERSQTFSWNEFFLLDEHDIYDQFADNHSWSNTVNARLTWTEPLGNVRNGNFLTVAYRFQYRWNNADKLTYDHDVVFPDGFEYPPLISPDGILNEELSNRFRNDFMNQDIRVGFKHVSKTSTMDVGLSLVPTMMKSEDLINAERNIAARWQWNVAPFLRYRYRMGKNRSLSINYRSRSSQPSISQLQPVADMSDPLRVVIGNPDLKATFSHNISLRFQTFSPESQRSIMAMMFAQVAQNSIISKTTFSQETGGQTTTYTNVNGVWNVRAMTMFSTPLRNKQFTFNNHLMASYDRSVGFNNELRNVSGALRIRESFSFAWRPDNAELELRPYYILQNTTNTVQKSANRNVHNYGGTFNGTYYTPVGIALNTDVSYSATKGYSAGYDTRQWMWNASISYQFLRDKQATVMLKAYDLLQQKKNVQRSVTANYIDDTMYNSLTRYFMVSFSYRFNTFGKGNEPKSRNEGNHRYGPGGGFGGGRPPMR